MEVRVEPRQVLFRLNSKEVEQRLRLQLSEEEWQQLCFHVYMYYPGQSIEIVSGS